MKSSTSSSACRLQIEFSRVVQQHTDDEGGEMSSEEICRLRGRYLARGRR
jgi:hypothetical protein